MTPPLSLFFLFPLSAKRPLLTPSPHGCANGAFSTIQQVFACVGLVMQTVTVHFHAHCSLQRVDPLADLGAEHTPLVPL